MWIWYAVTLIHSTSQRKSHSKIRLKEQGRSPHPLGERTEEFIVKDKYPGRGEKWCPCCIYQCTVSLKRVIEKRVIYLIQLIGHFKKEKGWANGMSGRNISSAMAMRQYRGNEGRVVENQLTEVVEESELALRVLERNSVLL